MKLGGLEPWFGLGSGLGGGEGLTGQAGCKPRAAKEEAANEATGHGWSWMFAHDTERGGTGDS